MVRNPMLLLKYFLAEKNLANIYLGGLNAYGLSLLLIAFFETYKGSLINQTNLLIKFCEFLA
jgi:DNA polymerase sigma